MFKATLLFILVLVNPVTTQAGGEMPRAAKATAVIVNLAVINGGTHFVTADHLHCVLRVLSNIAQYKNRYYTIRDLEKSCVVVPLGERERRAKLVAERMTHRLDTLKEIKFNVEEIRYQIDSTDPISQIPVQLQKRCQHSVSVEVIQTLTRMVVKIVAKGKPMYTYHLGKDWQFTEYNWSQKEYVTYPYDARNTVLQAGIKRKLLCLTGPYRPIWVGGDSAEWLKDHTKRNIPNHSVSATYRRFIGTGTWLGRATIQGEICDVVRSKYYEDFPFNYFFVTKQGYMVRREIFYRQANDQVLVEALDFVYLNSPVEASELLPPKLTGTWKKRETIMGKHGFLVPKPLGQ